MLFVPFSILFLWAFHKELLGESENIRIGKTVWEATKVVAVFSFMIEFTQLLFHLGTFQIYVIIHWVVLLVVSSIIWDIVESEKIKQKTEKSYSYRSIRGIAENPLF